MRSGPARRSDRMMMLNSLARTYSSASAQTQSSAGPHAALAFVGRIGDVDRDRLEVVVLHGADAADAFEVLVRQDRLIDFETLLLRGALEIEEVRTRADERDEAHHQLFADRVDRRVRHLREVLLEIGVQQLRLRRQRRDRRVGAHRADGFLALLGHRRHQELDAFLRVAEGLLQVQAAPRSTSPPTRTSTAAEDRRP